LLDDEQTLGVLEVLDRPEDSAFTLAEMDLLGLFANQAAIALALLQRARRARGRRRPRLARAVRGAARGGGRGTTRSRARAPRRARPPALTRTTKKPGLPGLSARS